MHPHHAARLKRLQRRLGHWLDHLAPRRCALCNQTLAPATVPGLCMPCLLDLPGAQAIRCSRCAMPSGASPCLCSQSGWPIARTVVAADYAPPLDRLITAMKFGRQLPLARPLGELLAAAWLADPHPASIDCLVPIPLAPERLARRGFNQALEMARAFNRCLHQPLPVMAHGLTRLVLPLPVAFTAIKEKALRMSPSKWGLKSPFMGWVVARVILTMMAGRTFS